MRTIFKATTATLTACLMLAACAEPDAGDDRVVDADAAAAAEIELTPIQEANLERFNREEFKANYTTIRQELMADGDPSIPADKATQFSFLDRNEDGGLDPAEYALASLSEPEGTGAMTGMSETATDEDIDAFLRGFFSLDSDGDSLLSKEEFGVLSGEGAEDGDTAEETDGGVTTTAN